MPLMSKVDNTLVIWHKIAITRPAPKSSPEGPWTTERQPIIIFFHLCLSLSPTILECFISDSYRKYDWRHENGMAEERHPLLLFWQAEAPLIFCCLPGRKYVCTSHASVLAGEKCLFHWLLSLRPDTATADDVTFDAESLVITFSDSLGSNQISHRFPLVAEFVRLVVTSLKGNTLAAHPSATSSDVELRAVGGVACCGGITPTSSRRRINAGITV
ncbi:hypothetical protein CPSG_04816 [Coccidioides posadasii str. Silveira]|uniref:Uncharacterized protein n=1 Tax=Coccidioides posadasii (strain RMSCC 757 / Silveira) TaxID=443226 RepID=E9D5D6_COCPS|nr:hypothetical protein CPSG_04816 [Coccidioides posadasii str. Silveira]